MNLYKKLLEEENKQKEIQRLKQNKRSLEYYYKNREYVLKRQAQKKILHPNYYKEWYEKNKEIIQDKRRIYNGAKKRVNKEYKKQQYDNLKKR